MCARGFKIIEASLPQNLAGVCALPSLQYWAPLYFSIFFVTLGDDDIAMKVASSQGLRVAWTFQSFHMSVTGD